MIFGRRAALAARLHASESRGRELELLCADLLREVAPDAPRLRWHARAAYQALRRVVAAHAAADDAGPGRSPADYCALPESASSARLGGAKGWAQRRRPYSAGRGGGTHGEEDDEDPYAAAEDAAAAAEAAAKERVLQTELVATKVSKRSTS